MEVLSKSGTSRDLRIKKKKRDEIRVEEGGKEIKLEVTGKTIKEEERDEWMIDDSYIIGYRSMKFQGQKKTLMTYIYKKLVTYIPV